MLSSPLPPRLRSYTALDTSSSAQMCNEAACERSGWSASWTEPADTRIRLK